jgi:hypothetical protein
MKQNGISISTEFFPPVPDMSGTVHAIFVTPIIGSGERICIGAIAIMPELGHSTTRAFPPDVYPALDGLNSIISESLLSIHSYLDGGGPLAEYQSPIQGIEIGEGITGKFRDLKMALHTVLRINSMFWREPIPVIA